MQEIREEKPKWPYKHRYTSVAQRTDDGKTVTVKVYTSRTPGMTFFMVAFLLFAVFAVLMAVAAISWLSQISVPVNP